jgi:alanyl-tRNA synthetase
MSQTTSSPISSTSVNDIRQSFLEFFEERGHRVVSSAPLVPYSDPTLMFVNAGMVPFKNVFTGLEAPPAQTAASAQKCVRAGGKHNDLDNVGYTARHHTFFEMLGNFSFGDYFKEEAIDLAWSLLTREWGLPANRLIVTVYHDDDEAYGLWRRIAGLGDDRIIRIATDDNFWSMGETGPCGPSSEIFFDHGEHIEGGPPGSANEDGDRFVEIWNLVFMQFDQLAQGTRTPLPKPSIDTGMGLERIAAVLQGVHDNYEVDLFRTLIGKSEELTGKPATTETQASHRIIADHLRSASFLLADGVMPSNEGRGYVLRRIMRRAMRHAHLLNADEPLMHRLVPALVVEMGSAYPELDRARPVIEDVLLREETQFKRTLDKGLGLLGEATAALSTGDKLDGRTVFKLYDTYGFPYDLTEDALREQGIAIDRAGFDAAMAEQRAAARAAWRGSGEVGDDDVWFKILERNGATEFTGYATTSGEGKITALLRDGELVDCLGEGESGILVANQTPFYGESGGQAGDHGQVRAQCGAWAVVRAVTKPLGKLHAHHIEVERGELRTGDIVQFDVDAARRDRIKANHSATHLLHAALRRRLGEHVTQKGSLVEEDRLRFDFSHPRPLDAEEIELIEADVNAEIRHNETVAIRLMHPDEAVASGALALFGEKYGDEVRVLSMGRMGEAGRNYSIELCGGTHVDATGDIALFRIVSENAVSAGVRRIEALTGEEARRWLVSRDETVKRIAAAVKSPAQEVEARVGALLEERKRLERELSEIKRQLALGGSGKHPVVEAEQAGGIAFSGRVVEGIEPKELRPLLDEEKRRMGSGIGVLIALKEGRAAIAVGVTDDLLDDYDAVELVRRGVEVLGGKGGGGRRDMAQGGGPDGERAGAALAAVKDAVASAKVA